MRKPYIYVVKNRLTGATVHEQIAAMNAAEAVATVCEKFHLKKNHLIARRRQKLLLVDFKGFKWVDEVAP